MADLFQFDEQHEKHAPLCLACEALLADALDETLSAADQAWFEQHTATCAACSAMLADAQRGAAWLEMLKRPRPEPSAQLIERILAETEGSGYGVQAAPVPYLPAVAGPLVVGAPALLPVAMPAANVLAFRPARAKMPGFSAFMASAFRASASRGSALRGSAFRGSGFEPRLAMTAAMAFFSIALTLNLSGVRLDQLHASSLNPSSLKKTYYEANAGAVRYYDNLSVVRVMESRVDSLRDANRDANRDASEDRPQPKPAPEPAKPQQTKPADEKKPGGMSERMRPQDGPGDGSGDRSAVRARTVLTSATQSIWSREGGLV